MGVLARTATAGVLALTGVVGAFAAEPVERPRRFGVVGFYNPRLMYEKYQPLVDYLSDQTSRTWELRVRTTYGGVVEDLCEGRVDVAYFGPLTYIRAHARCGARPIVRLATRGQSTYRSVILVRSDDPANDLYDLIGFPFAFGSPLSTSSHLVPRAMLLEAGLEVGREVECRYFAHHERAARAVLLGEARACGIRDLVAEEFLRRGLRVLKWSDPIPNFPFAVSPEASPALVDELVDCLVDRPYRNPDLRRLMRGWDEELAGGFRKCSDAEFDSIRALASAVFGQAALSADADELECDGGQR